MVYVLDSNNKPLMPTKRHGKVKHLLRSGKAVVVKRTPFTIKLLYESKGYVQPVTLGVDAGSKVVGLSATTEREELYATEAILRTDIVVLLTSKPDDKLDIMCKTANGFEVAEEDMRMRGAGKLNGLQQSGYSKEVELIIKYPKLARMAMADAGMD